MNISEALIAAADSIERHPDKYCFSEGNIPPEGFQGCMLGHFGRVAGLPVGLGVDIVSLAVLGKPANQFYAEIQAADGAVSVCDSIANTNTIPGAMRKVAQNYAGIPESVRDIFDSVAKDWQHPLNTAEFYLHLARAHAARRAGVTA